MANSISTSTFGNASAFPAGSLVAVATTGDVLVLWCDGTGSKFSYASSPYSSWTTTTLVSNIGGGPAWEAALYHNPSDDSIIIVAGDGSRNMGAWKLTYSSGGHSWSAGSENTVSATAQTPFNGDSLIIDRDLDGRYWVCYEDANNNLQVFYSADAVTWTNSLTVSSIGAGQSYAMAVIGNYTCVVYGLAANPFQGFQRIQSNTATLGSWSAATTPITSGMLGGQNLNCLRQAGTSGSGILVSGGAAGGAFDVYALRYVSGTNTWDASATILDSNTASVDPTLISDGTDLYCIWCQEVAANSFALVYKKYIESTTTWDASATTLEASGNNIQVPSLGYGDSLLGFVYTQGTVSPWTVYFDYKSFGSTAHNMGAEARSFFAIHTTLGGEARTRFAIRMPLGAQARDKFAIRTALGTQARSRFAIRAVLGAVARSKFAIIALLGAEARSKFAIRTTLEAIARSRFAIRIHTLAIEARDKFLIFSNLKQLGLEARSKFAIRAVQGLEGRSRFNIRTTLAAQTRSRFAIRFTQALQARSRFAVRISALGAELRDRFSIAAVLRGSARDSFIIRKALAGIGRVVFVINQLVAPSKPATLSGRFSTTQLLIASGQAVCSTLTATVQTIDYNLTASFTTR